MGGRKFRMERHRKNEERKIARPSMIVSVPRNAVTLSVGLMTIQSSAPVLHPVVQCQSTDETSTMLVSFPLSAFMQRKITSVDVLLSRLEKISLPSMWVILGGPPLVVCRMHSSQLQTTVLMSVKVTAELQWSATVLDKTVTSEMLPVLGEVPSTISAVTELCRLVDILDGVKLCIGNPDDNIVQLYHSSTYTLHSYSGHQAGYIDTALLNHRETVHHKNCKLIIHPNSRAVRCSACSTYRSTLLTQKWKRANLVARLGNIRTSYRSLLKQLERLRSRIHQDTEVKGVFLDEECNAYIKDIICLPETAKHLESLPEDSFKHIFWQQQIEAASQHSSRHMRWHPLMIRFCLSLRHKSGGAYELLRESGCIKLPSQRTLRDYTHYVQSCEGFSADVDVMLRNAVNVESCPEREKYVAILIDEMHVREDLVFDRWNGNLVGFANLGETNNHLMQLESALTDGNTAPSQAKTMVVFMIRGLFTKLQFPYAQFPCCALKGDQLYDPFWEAVGRVENCGLKVLAVTMDGSSANRKLIKLHNTSSDVTYRIANPYTAEKRFLFFISDPPHLIKTTRNCWHNRMLWNNGKYICWDQLKQFYDMDTAKAVGMRILPKLKFEHIYLTAFSKMRVDLAAQVLSESVSKALVLFCGDECNETSQFVEMMDKFFDALNVHNYSHGSQALKPFQLPYTSREDPRLKWLVECFLKYLEDWERSVVGRSGFSLAEKSNMLLSEETLYGLKMTSSCVSDGYLLKSVKALLDDKAFLMPSASATSALKMAQDLMKWMPSNDVKVKAFQNDIVELLRGCIKPIKLLTSSKKTCTRRRVKMWSSYHVVRTSQDYVDKWMAFLRDSSTLPATQLCPVFFQYVGNQIFRQLVRDECGFSLECSNLGTTEQLTYEELNALRYTAGYVPRALQKKLFKHPRQKDLQLYLNELISDGSEAVTDFSDDWLTAVNRGGLIVVNNMAFELFHTMECEFRHNIQPTGIVDNAVELILNNEDVLFLWSIISNSWDQDCSSELLERMVKLWITLRGFSLCGALMEQYKVTNKITTQKSKAMRKELG
eukprot:Em0015g881a